MTRLLLALSTFLISATIMHAQIWENVGPVNTPVAANVLESEFVIADDGTPYLFFITSDTQKGTVVKWDGSNWINFGPASFTESNPFNIRIGAFGQTVYVSYYFNAGGTQEIKVHEVTATGNVDLSDYLGNGLIETNHNDPYDFDVSPNGDLHLAFYEPTSANTFIHCAYRSMFGHFVNDYSDLPGSIQNTMKIETDMFGNDWVLAKTGNQVELFVRDGINWSPVQSMFQGGLYFNVDLSYNYDFGGNDVRVSGITSNTNSMDLKFAQYENATLNFTNSGQLSTDVGYFDIASDSNKTIIFSSSGSAGGNLYLGMYDHSADAYTPILNPFLADYSHVQVELKINGEPAVSYIDANGDLWVYESWQPVSFVVDANLEVCSGITEVIQDAVTVQSQNLDNTELLFNVTHPLGTISVASANLGNWPNYDLTITTQKVYSNETIALDFDLYRSGGVLENSAQENIVVKAVDSIYSTYQGFAVCENAGVINFNNYIYPLGGNWSGDITSNGLLNPATSPNPSTFYYSTISSEGCFNQHPLGLNINDVPTANVVDSDAGCNDSTGTAIVTANGGTAPYSYYWTTGADSTNLTGLPAGQYFVTVTDNNGCMATGVANIGNTSVNLVATASTLDCPDDNNGSIDLTIAGVGPFDILWSNGYSTEDLTGLSAGTYDVTVEDANGCVATETYTISAPDEMEVSFSISDASCGGSNGTVTPTITGGTAPLTYIYLDAQSNSVPGTMMETIGVSSGTYTIVITDANGCQLGQQFVISENGGPTVSVNQVTNASCNNDGAIDISISSSANIVQIDWSHGPTTEDVSNLSPGSYTVTVLDDNGCSSLTNVQVYAAVPATPEICVVTVDSASTRNLVVWEKAITSDISHYNIYREGSVAGVYVKVDSVLYSEDSEFIDYVASPMVRSWRYKLSAVNNCGVESSLSDYHKTIHATINLGLGGNVNILWDSYEGITYSTWSCYRYTDVNGFETIWTNSSNVFSYTDTPPSMNQLDYVIGFDLPATCSSSLLKAQDYNGTRSNRSAGVFMGSGLGLDDINETEFDVTIFPNPANESTNIHITGNANGLFDLEIVDARGRIVKSEEDQQRKFVLDLSQFENGVYYLTITNNNVKKVSKLIVNQ